MEVPRGSRGVEVIRDEARDVQRQERPSEAQEAGVILAEQIDRIEHHDADEEARADHRYDKPGDQRIAVEAHDPSLAFRGRKPWLAAIGFPIGIVFFYALAKFFISFSIFYVRYLVINIF